MGCESLFLAERAAVQDQLPADSSVGTAAVAGRRVPGDACCFPLHGSYYAASDLYRPRLLTIPFFPKSAGRSEGTPTAVDSGRAAYGQLKEKRPSTDRAHAHIIELGAGFPFARILQPYVTSMKSGTAAGVSFLAGSFSSTGLRAAG